MVSWLLGVLATAAWCQETVEDAELGFRLKLPEGFAPAPDIAKQMPDVAHAFVRSGPDAGQGALLLYIKRLPGTIGPERLAPKDLPPGFQGTLSVERWGPFTVDVVAVREDLGRVRMLTYNAQIPLKKQAVQLSVFGAAHRKAELEQVLREALAGLEGESNWVRQAPPTRMPWGVDTYGFVLLGVGLAIVIAGLLGLWLVSKKTPKGGVLVIAVAIYIGSLAIDRVMVREGQMLAGSLRMLGFVGGILGIIDLIRKRKPKPPRASASPGP